ncbi:hypothetical protein DdX_10497 [Ditylenchus destructor]|uniref:Uncharacterized protein n=1 Tax=Ditylenchus destructor TaxID=166010 RepID=A0AAD4MZY4_9BILA|nr:hypothetical protein DdX_10497 [Ditylenchus destructor]
MEIARWLLLFVSIATISTTLAANDVTDRVLDVTEAPNTDYEEDQEQAQAADGESEDNEVIITESPEDADLNDPDAVPPGYCFEACDSWLQQIVTSGLNVGSAKAMLWSCNAYGNYVMCLNENCGSMETADIPKVELDRMMEKRLGYALIEPGCPEPQVFVDMFKCRDKVIGKKTCRRTHTPSFKMGLQPYEVDPIITKMLTNLKCEENILREQCGDMAANLAIRSVRQRIFTYLSFRGWSYHPSDQSSENKDLLEYFTMREVTSLIKEDFKYKTSESNDTKPAIALPYVQNPSGAGTSHVSSLLIAAIQVVVLRVFL